LHHSESNDPYVITLEVPGIAKAEESKPKVISIKS